MDMPRQINGWEECGHDYLQYGRYKGDRVYEFIRAEWLDSTDEKCFTVCTDEIHLKDFFLREIELAICTRFKDITDMEQKYHLPIGQLDDIIADCYFDTYCINDGCSIGGVYTEEEAKQIIIKYITKE